VVLEQHAERERLEECGEGPWPALLVVVLDVLGQLGLLLGLGVLQVVVHVLIEENQCSCSRLIDLKVLVFETRIDQQEKLLDGCEVEFEENHFEMVTEDGLQELEHLLV
jgi:CHASE1-domain containing sensor protein